jgi:hypothetical protein
MAAHFAGRIGMLTVHHLGKSQSERIVWLCEELAVPYELRPSFQLANEGKGLIVITASPS